MYARIKSANTNQKQDRAFGIIARFTRQKSRSKHGCIFHSSIYCRGIRAVDDDYWPKEIRKRMQRETHRTCCRYERADIRILGVRCFSYDCRAVNEKVRATDENIPLRSRKGRRMQ